MNSQAILVILISAGAIFFLGARFYKAIFGKNKHGDCPTCGLNDTKVPGKKVS